jgi:hypothetical protein
MSYGTGLSVGMALASGVARWTQSPPPGWVPALFALLAGLSWLCDRLGADEPGLGVRP